MNKGEHADLLDQVMGSKAFTAVARSVLLVAEDPNDDAGPRRLLGQLKSNLGPVSPTTEVFTIEPVTVADGVDAPRVLWHDPVERPIARVVVDAETNAEADSSAVASATRWLADYLTAYGPTSSKTVKDQAVEAGHSESGLHRAKRALGVVVENTRTVPRRTLWSLPDTSTTGE